MRNELEGVGVPVEEPDHIACQLDSLLEARGMTLTELARRVDMTPREPLEAQNNRAKAIRFSTLTAICRELQCQPGDLFSARE